MMGCTICNNFKGRWPIDSWADSEKHRGQGIRSLLVPRFTWDELLASARSCYCCDILVRGCRGCFDLHGVDVLDIEYGSLRFIYPSHTEDVEDADTDKHLTFYLDQNRRFEVELFATEDNDCQIPDNWDYFPVLSRTSASTNSKSALARIKGWIAGCIVDHSDSFCDTPECPELPTRVVDVGLGDGLVKLVETNGMKAKYICLSHCWGLEHIIITTLLNLNTWKQEIAWGNLSKTFQDAIALTRTLGFRYIWIDSLCIIQDDARDWEIESTKMASIYSNGHLTIAATQSHSGRGGLYSRTPDFKVTGTTPDSNEPYCLFFRERIDHQIDAIKDSHGFTPSEKYYPLLTRAWVYQERMLSTRVLHFGRYEVFFECKSSISCECDAIQNHGAGHETPVPLIKLEYADALWQYDAPSEEETLVDIQYRGAQLWRTMVCCYTALSLTKSKDRLPAIGGLARQMFTGRKSKYLAGLWEESIQDDLLWEVYTTSSWKKPRPSPRNAPTWSWASVEVFVGYWDVIMFSSLNGSVVEERAPFQHLSTIEACDVKKSAIDEFGSIARGSIKITGLIAEGILEREVEIHEDAERIVYYISLPNTRVPVASDYLLDDRGPDHVEPGSTVYCLRMSLLRWGQKDCLISLVLRKSPENSDTFERIGSSKVTGKPDSVDTRGEVFSVSRSQTVTIV